MLLGLTIFHLIGNINNDNNFQMLHHLIISIQFDVRRRFRIKYFNGIEKMKCVNCERKFSYSLSSKHIYFLISKFTKWNRRKIDNEMHFFFVSRKTRLSSACDLNTQHLNDQYPALVVLLTQNSFFTQSHSKYFA